MTLSNLPISQTNHTARSPIRVRDETEELLMSDFNKLPIDEQARALDDIYSAGSELRENPAVIDKLLTDFEKQVERGNYPIYQLAVEQDRSYVEDPGFRLMFLRANLHDVNKAVSQMISFLRQKAKYFGADKVTSDITLNDLSPDELKLMLSGIYHIQDETDRHGRVIFMSCPNINQLAPLESEIRVLYYMCFNIMLRLHSVQMKGSVRIHYHGINGGNKRSGRGEGEIKRLVEFMTSIPIRYSAFHLCITRPGGNIKAAPVRDSFLRFGIKGLPKYMRERARVHHGSAVDLKHKLATYGIPQDSFPIDVNGNTRDSIRNSWFYKHLEQERGIIQHLVTRNDDDSLSSDEESPSENLVYAVAGGGAEEDNDDVISEVSAEDHQENAFPPLPYTNEDVLLGRGHEIQNHPGNAAFRAFLSEHQDEYDVAPRLSKRNISRNLTRQLMANGVRFWQKTDRDIWIETSFDEAEKKVGQVFRSARKRTRDTLV